MEFVWIYFVCSVLPSLDTEITEVVSTATYETANSFYIISCTKLF
jgi:hypothetical protein